MNDTKNTAAGSWLKRILSYSSGEKTNAEIGEKKSKFPAIAGYIFLSVPMYIFFFGWLSLPIALVMAAVLTVGLYFAFMSAPRTDISFITKSQGCRIAAGVIIALFWVYLSGVGQFAYQNYDHMWRNAVLEKLVNEPWPVTIADTQGYFQNPVALIYYFALWLPAALFGKSFGLEAAHTFLYFWCTIGVTLVFLLLASIRKKLALPMLIAFVCFSGLDAVGNFIINNSTDFIWFTTDHIENWAPGFQMSSFSTQLFWVFNQAIPAWLITLLLLIQQDNRSLIFVYSFSFMSCTLPAIGMIPIIACIGITRIVKTYDRKIPVKYNLIRICREALTVQNVITGLLVTLVSFLFLKANATSGSGFRATEMGKLFMSYLIFVLLEFGVYFIAINKLQRKNPLYWVSFATLLIVPMISFGPHVDFVMRASIPSLIVLFVMIFDTVDKSIEAGNKLTACALSVLLILGGITAYHEISRSVDNTIKHINDPAAPIVADRIDLLEDGNRGNFFGEYQDSLFFKYLSR